MICMAIKTKLEGEIEESKTKTENCKNDFIILILKRKI